MRYISIQSVIDSAMQYPQVKEMEFADLDKLTYDTLVQAERTRTSDQSLIRDLRQKVEDRQRELGQCVRERDDVRQNLTDVEDALLEKEKADMLHTSLTSCWRRCNEDVTKRAIDSASGLLASAWGSAKEWWNGSPDNR